MSHSKWLTTSPKSELCGRGYSTYALYKRGPGLDSRHGDQLSRHLRSFPQSLESDGQHDLPLRHGGFLPDPFQSHIQ